MSEVVTHSFFWADAPTAKLKEFVDSQRAENFSGSRAVSRNPDDENGMPIEYQEYIADIFENVLGMEVTEWRFWIGVTLPDRVNKHYPQFAKGFPHAHGWDGMTAVHYVQAADEGGDLVVVDKDHNVLVRPPSEVGYTAIVDGRSMHGVEAVKGATPRLTVIATAFPKGEQV